MTFKDLLKVISKRDSYLLLFAAVCSCLQGLCKVIDLYLIAEVAGVYVEAQKIKNDENLSKLQKEAAAAQFSDEIYAFSLNFLSIAFVWFCLHYIAQCIFFAVSERIHYNLRASYFRALLFRDITWYDRNNAGETSSKLLSSTNLLKAFMEEHAWKLFFHAAVILSTFLISIYTNWKLALLYQCLYPFITVAAHYFNKKVAAKSTYLLSQYAKAGAVAKEALTQIRTVIGFNGQKYEVERYKNALDEATKQELWSTFYQSIGQNCLHSAMNVVYFVVYWYGTDFVYYDWATVDEVLKVFNCVNAFSFAISHFMNTQQKGTVALDGCQQILEEVITASKAEKSEVAERPELHGKICFDDVHFSYPSRPEVPILKGLTFTCEPGEKVAFVGTTGAGKSTIFSLIMKFYDPAFGKIAFDNTNAAKVDTQYLRSEIGVVSQEPVLFDATIRENLLYSKPAASKAELLEVLDQANALNFVKELPDGIDTRVGARGAQLSGGQKQRIAIARMLLRNPKILLLDEATSALDTKNERAIQEALDKACFGRTTLIIAHRLSTIKNADKIVVIKDGKVAETGSHQNLLQAKGAYFELVNSQVFEDPEKKEESENDKNDNKDFQRLLSVQKEKSPKPKRKRELLQKAGSLKKYYEMLGTDKKYFFFAIFMAVTEGIVPPLYGIILMQRAVAFATNDKEELLRNGHAAAWNWVYLGIFEFFRVVPRFISIVLSSCRLAQKIRVQIFKNVLHQNGDFHDAAENSSGKIVSYLASDVAAIKDLFGEYLGTLTKAVSSFSIGFAIAFYLEWRSASIMLFVVPFGLFHSVFIEKLMETFYREEAKSNTNSSDLLSESIENIRTVQALTLQTPLLQKYSDCLEIRRRNGKQKGKYLALGSGVACSLQVTMNFFKQFFAAVFTSKYESFEPMQALRVQSSLTNCVNSGNESIKFLSIWTKAKISAEILDRFMDIENTENLLVETQETDYSEISFVNVSFAYPEHPDDLVLKDFNAVIKSGQKIGLVGQSGSGKSTIVALLQRIYELKNGKIKIGGKEISGICKRKLRSEIAVVSQEPTLFDDTIWNNICYGLEPELAHEADLHEAAQIAGVHDFIQKLPVGYQTRVGSLGSQLSGGQKQRIAIARALIRKPKILIFDEATSALDSETEKSVQKAIDLAAFGTTCITIAHRLSTIRNCDQIYVLEKGRLVEQGKHDTLMRLQGYYARMAQQSNQ
ncbi:unnamed protein product, partial [Mesorhabditis spiculigera]